MSYPNYDAYFRFFGQFLAGNGMATTRAPNGLGPPNPSKVLVRCLEIMLIFRFWFLDLLWVEHGRGCYAGV